MVTVKKALASGMFIAMGVFVFLSCDIKYIGAFLFSLGLFCVCEYKLNLFTGMIGYAVENTKEKGARHILDLVKVVLLNMVSIAFSCFLLSFTAGSEVIEKATNIVETSVTLSFPSLFVKSIMCGVIMLIAVDRYRNCDGMAKYIAVFVGIPVFILSGYYHSIAYIGYLTLGICGGNLSDNVTVPKIIYVILIAVIGNAAGSILTRYLTTSKEK